MRKRPILTIIGGGVWIIALLEQLVSVIKEDQLDIRLVARDSNRLRHIAEHCRRQSVSRPDWSILSQNIETAINGADICVLLFRVGGFAARELDEHFPRTFDQIGDEGLGLGGYANALRTTPTMVKIAKKLAAASPNVIALNLVAPLGIATRVLLDHGVKAVGLCELPITTERVLKRNFGPNSNQALSFTGLNHIGWFWSHDLDVALFERAVAAGVVDESVLHKFGAAPLKYYYKVFNPEAARALRIEQNPRRAQELRQIAALTLNEIQSGQLHVTALHGRTMPWFDDALVPVLGALIDDGSWRGFANLQPAAKDSWYQRGSVIEGRTRIDRTSMILEFAPDPGNVNLFNFLETAARAEAHVYHGAMGDDPQKSIRTALEEGPLELPRAQLSAITRAICDAGRQFLSA
jgi:hypothetical protein